MRDAWLDEHGKQRTETVFNRDGQPTGEAHGLTRRGEPCELTN